MHFRRHRLQQLPPLNSTDNLVLEEIDGDAKSSEEERRRNKNALFSTLRQAPISSFGRLTQLPSMVLPSPFYPSGRCGLGGNGVDGGSMRTARLTSSGPSIGLLPELSSISDRMWTDMRDPERFLVAAAAAAALDRRPGCLANLLCQSIVAGRQRTSFSPPRKQ